MLAQLDDLAGEATKAMDKGVTDLGNLADKAKTDIGNSGASGSVVNSISSAISGVISKFTNIFESTLKPAVDGELSKIKTGMSDTLDKVSKMEDCAKSNGKDISFNKNNFVSCVVGSVEEITARINKIVNLITEEVTKIINNAMSGLQQCSQSNNMGMLQRAFSTQNRLLCIPTLVKNVIQQSFKLATVVIGEVTQVVIASAKEAAKVPVCSASMLTGVFGQLKDMNLDNCIKQ